MTAIVAVVNCFLTRKIFRFDDRPKFAPQAVGKSRTSDASALVEKTWQQNNPVTCRVCKVLCQTQIGMCIGDSCVSFTFIILDLSQ